MVETLTKAKHLVTEMKGDWQTMNYQISNIPIAEIRKEQIQTAEKLNERIEALEKCFNELKDIIMLRTNQSFNIDPELLKQWDPTMLVIRRSPWTNMRLILNKVALDNIADLFPNDWAPKPLFSELQEKHFNVMSEMMTTMFHQCGILQDCHILSIQGYEKFLKLLHHHMVMGNVIISHLGNFLILMIYLSFFRMNHNIDYITDEGATNLGCAVEPCYHSFQDHLHYKGSHRTINPYFKVLNTIVRRR